MVNVPILARLILCLATLTTSTSLLADSSVIYGREEPLEEKLIDSFIDAEATELGYSSKALRTILAQARVQKSILEAIANPAEKKKWFEYRPIFIQKSRIEGGVKFQQENTKLLEKAQKEYGVNQDIITAIIGIETRYGRYTGKYRVLDALSTLAFHYPRRSKFFRGELIQFLKLTREEKINPTEALGSYAGAMGMPQFIPSSYRNYSIDFDKNGKRDLWNSKADVIGSVANYFSRHGWQKDGLIAIPAKATAKAFKKLGHYELATPRHTISELKKIGVTPLAKVDDSLKAELLTLELEDDVEFWLVFHNFYVITRYNHSSHYAMAAFQLSGLINEQAKNKK